MEKVLGVAVLTVSALVPLGTARALLGVFMSVMFRPARSSSTPPAPDRAA